MNEGLITLVVVSVAIMMLVTAAVRIGMRIGYRRQRLYGPVTHHTPRQWH